jgi:hypothetical protein
MGLAAIMAGLERTAALVAITGVTMDIAGTIAMGIRIILALRSAQDGAQGGVLGGGARLSTRTLITQRHLLFFSNSRSSTSSGIRTRGNQIIGTIVRIPRAITPTSTHALVDG